jgi:acyl-CoA thioester hydrolase
LLESVIEFRVRYAETDQMGVVYHTNYLVWCEMGRTDLIRRLGTSYADLEARGTFLAVSEARVRFRAPTRYDDMVRVRTRLTRLRSRGVSFAYWVEDVKTGTVLAEAETDLICLDRAGSPRKLSPEVREVLEAALEGVPDEGTKDALSGV